MLEKKSLNRFTLLGLTDIMNESHETNRSNRSTDPDNRFFRLGSVRFLKFLNKSRYSEVASRNHRKFCEEDAAKNAPPIRSLPSHRSDGRYGNVPSASFSIFYYATIIFEVLIRGRKPSDRYLMDID